MKNMESFRKLNPISVIGTRTKADIFFNKKQRIREEYIAPLPKENDRKDTFQRAMKLTVVTGQCFGLNPVIGVCNIDSSKLRFSILSWRSLYTAVSIFGQSILFGAVVINIIISYDMSFSSTTTFVFYSTNFLTTILFYRIATQWPKLCRHISKLESMDPNVDTSITRKCNLSCIIILILAIVEHLLSDISGLAIAMACQPDTELYTAFSYQSFPWLFRFFNYHPLVGVLAQFINIQFTFNWNFANIFVICLSWYLEARIVQINERIDSFRGKHTSSALWRKMREDYCKATNLVRKVDDVINGVIFITFANNLFAICWQLLHVLEEGFQVVSVCGRTPEERPMMHGFEQVVYFAYSFFFLMGRSLAVSLIAAKVHSASRETVKGLYDVPSSAYCIEVQRFMEQVHGDDLALTGLQFFNIKRGLVLAITGTIITYELVLMQFTGVSKHHAVLPPGYAPELTYSSYNNVTSTVSVE